MKHLDEVNETYWEHFKFASRTAFVLMLTGIILFVHAIFPEVQKDTASDVIKHLNAILDKRQNGDSDDDDEHLGIG